MKVTNYQYLFKLKGSDKINVKFLCGPDEEHEAFAKSILSDDSVESCLREYVYEVDFCKFGVSETVKAHVAPTAEEEEEK